MERIRFWCAALFGWFFIFYNIERLFQPINLASFVYVLAPMLGLPFILFSWPQTLAVPWLFLFPVPAVILLKLWLGYSVAGTALPLTVTELVAVWVTMLLARHIGRSFEELRGAALTTLVSHLHERSRPFEQGQGEIYREIRRARTFKRPLTLLAIAPTSETVQASVDRFTKDLQRETVQHYMRMRIAELLSAELRDCDIITHSNGCFVTLLPETGRAMADDLIARIGGAAKEKLGLTLSVGLSVFPEEEVTFVKLLERAEARMHAGARPADHPVDAAAAQTDWPGQAGSTVGTAERRPS